MRRKSCILNSVKTSALYALFAGQALLLAGCAGVSGRLTHDDPQVRAMALDEVLRSGEAPRRKAAAGIKKVLARGKPPYDLYAASALEDLGQSAAPAVPELMAALSAPDATVAYTAARALAKTDAAVPALAEALRSGSPELRREAARILPAHGAKAAAALQPNLQGPDRDLAERSARILAETGPAAASAVPALAKAVHTSTGALKHAAADALTRIGTPAGKWLAAALKAPDPKVRAAAAGVLAAMNPPSPEAAVPLSAALDDPEPAVRAGAARALAAYPPEAQTLFPENFISALFRAAQAPDSETRDWACITLVRTGTAGGKWLANALKAPDPAARAGAGRVISRMFPPPAEAAAAALDALADPEAAVRAAALEALTNYALSAPAALPPGAAARLAGALKDKDPAFRAALLLPLQRLSRRSREGIAAMTGALEDPSPEVKRSAASALGALGPAARRAIPALRDALRSRDCPLRALAANALISIDPAFKKNASAVKAASASCPGARRNARIKPLEKAALDTSAAFRAPGLFFSTAVANTYDQLQPVTPAQKSTAPGK